MTSSSATTDVSQRINLILGGTVIGVQYNVTSPKREPPSTEQVIAYLSAIEAPGAAEKSPALQRFYEAEFRVVGQEPPQELGTAIQQIWSEGNEGQPPPSTSCSWPRVAQARRWHFSSSASEWPTRACRSGRSSPRARLTLKYPMRRPIADRRRRSFPC